MKMNRKFVWLAVLASLAVVQASAQVLGADQLKKIVPASYFFAGQSASVQVRNSAGYKTAGGKVVLAGLVDTSGYSTGIAEKYQGFLITEIRLNFAGTTLEPGQYGFGFREGKFGVLNVASTDLFTVDSQNDEALKHPVPLKFEKEEGGFRFYAGRKYVVVKAE